AGSIIYAHLDEPTRMRLRDTAQSPELKTVINLARKGRKLREQVAEFLQSSLDIKSQSGPVIRKMIEAQFGDFAGFYSDNLLEAFRNSTSVEQQLNIVRLLLRDWSRVFTEEVLSEENVRLVAEQANIHCDDRQFCRDELARTFEETTLSKLRVTV